MRVIAGTLRGRRLRAPAGRGTRPTSDRVREALFSMLAEDVSGSLALDLFAGTGALGIEALSRGARGAVFVESDPRAARALRENLGALDLGAERAEVRLLDAYRALRQAGERGETYDLIFIDPPYTSVGEWEGPLAAALPPLLGSGALVAVESDRRRPLALELPLRREKTYGDTYLRIHGAEA